MLGFAQLGALALWMLLTLYVSVRMARRFEGSKYWSLVILLVWAILITFPFGDELIGRFQFERVCRSDLARVDAAAIRGRSVLLSFDPSNELIPHTAVPIRHTSAHFKDAASSRDYGQYEEYSAEGGLLVRLLGLSESRAPILIDPPYCGPRDSPATLADRFGFTLIK